MFTNPLIKDCERIRGDYQTKVIDERRKKGRSVIVDAIIPALAMTLFNPLFWIGFFLFYR